MDETIDNLARQRVAPQQTMTMEQRVTEFFQLFPQLIGGVAVVMNMDVNVAEPLRRKPRQLIQVRGLIFFLREEKGVLGRQQFSF